MTATVRADPAAGDEVAGRPTGVVRAGLFFAYLAAFTIPWSGFRLGGLAFGDAFLVLAAMLLAGADLQRALPRFPPWVWFFAATILLSGTANQLFPPTTEYLTSRDQLYNNYIVLHVPTPPSTNLAVMLPMLIRLLLLSLVFGAARSHDVRTTTRFALTFVGGTAVCSLIAFTDSRGFTSIGASLVGIPTEANGRAAGLTQSPNGVAMIDVFSLPIAAWRIQAGRGRGRFWSVIALVAVLLGLYASGSRSGAAAGAVAIVVALLWLPGFRRQLPTVVLGLAAVASAVFVAEPRIGGALLRTLRITGGSETTSGSDAARSIVNTQGLHDFLHSPIWGVGFEVSEQAHIIYLQALAVGGLLLLAGLIVYLGGALVRSARVAGSDPFAVALFAAVLGGAIFNAAQNALTPTFVYFIDALVSVLPVTAGRWARGD